MNLLIIDGQGGQLGVQLIKEILARFQSVTVTAVGTNTVATAAMLKAGAHFAATGENPAVVACRKADVILGPIGIVIADSLLGEITENTALAVARAAATRILIPMNKCDNIVAGVSNGSTKALIDDAVLKLEIVMKQKAIDKA